MDEWDLSMDPLAPARASFGVGVAQHDRGRRIRKIHKPLNFVDTLEVHDRLDVRVLAVCSARLREHPGETSSVNDADYCYICWKEQDPIPGQVTGIAMENKNKLGKIHIVKSVEHSRHTDDTYSVTFCGDYFQENNGTHIRTSSTNREDYCKRCLKFNPATGA